MMGLCLLLAKLMTGVWYDLPTVTMQRYREQRIVTEEGDRAALLESCLCF